MPRLEINGIQTHYQQRGRGPDVVLIHAFTSNLSIWFLSPLIDTLTHDFRVTAYDLRGHGLTTPTPTGYTSVELAADFRQLHEALGLQPAWLVGHSFGGVIAAHAALDYPDRVRGILLSDTYFPALRHLEPEMGQAEPWRDLRGVFGQVGIELGETVDFSRLFRAVAALTDDQKKSLETAMGPPATRWLSQMGQLAPTTAGEEMFEVAGLTAERLAQIQQPIVGLYDEFSPFTATQRYLESHLPHCITDVVPGARHLALVQSPEEFTRMTHEHLLRLQKQGDVAGDAAGSDN